jgi:4-carboxymuconolactone decarboxylase
VAASNDATPGGAAARPDEAVRRLSTLPSTPPTDHRPRQRATQATEHTMSDPTTAPDPTSIAKQSGTASTQTGFMKAEFGAALRNNYGDFAPGLAEFTDDVVFGQVWTRPQLSPKERSLVTLSCLTTSGNTDELAFHVAIAKRNGATEAEIVEVFTHLAFYAGWPKAMSAIAVARRVLRPED